MSSSKRSRNCEDSRRILSQPAGRPVILIEMLLCVCGTACSCEIETIGRVTDRQLIHTYSVYKNQTTWTDADNRCATLIPNNHLAILDSADKVSELASRLNNSGRIPVWIAGHLNYSNWTWLDNSNIEERMFTSKQKDVLQILFESGVLAPGSGNCLSLNYTTLMAIPCEKELRGYMCTFNDLCPVEYGLCLFNSSSKSVVLFNTGESHITWKEARYHCSSMNAELSSLSKGSKFNTSIAAHVGGRRTVQWWWSYDSATDVKPLSQTDSLVITDKESLDLCLVLTGQGLAAANCTDEYIVLCEDTQAMPSALNNVYIIIGVVLGVFVLFLVIIIALALHRRRVRKKPPSDQEDDYSIPNSAASTSARPNPYELGTGIIYMEALQAYPEYEHSSTIEPNTGHRP